VVEQVEGKVLVKTFLFLTMEDTPEGVRLRKRLLALSCAPESTPAAFLTGDGPMCIPPKSTARPGL
jgi:hypothetical protein